MAFQLAAGSVVLPYLVKKTVGQQSFIHMHTCHCTASVVIESVNGTL